MSVLLLLPVYYKYSVTFLTCQFLLLEIKSSGYCHFSKSLLDHHILWLIGLLLSQLKSISVDEFPNLCLFTSYCVCKLHHFSK